MFGDLLRLHILGMGGGGGGVQVRKKDQVCQSTILQC